MAYHTKCNYQELLSTSGTFTHVAGGPIQARTLSRGLKVKLFLNYDLSTKVKKGHHNNEQPQEQTEPRGKCIIP